MDFGHHSTVRGEQEAVGFIILAASPGVVTEYGVAQDIVAQASVHPNAVNADRDERVLQRAVGVLQLDGGDNGLDTGVQQGRVKGVAVGIAFNRDRRLNGPELRRRVATVARSP